LTLRLKRSNYKRDLGFGNSVAIACEKCGIKGFHWAILGGESHIDLAGFALSLVIVVVLLWSGIWYFRKMERTFADVI